MIFFNLDEVFLNQCPTFILVNFENKSDELLSNSMNFYQFNDFFPNLMNIFSKSMKFFQIGEHF